MNELLSQNKSIYLQVSEMIETDILRGILLEEERVPSTNEIAKPRMIAMYLAKTMTGASQDAIGSFLGGRDHSTVIHGIKRVEAEIQDNEAMKNQIEVIKKKINPN